jgi:hypothetical protein
MLCVLCRHILLAQGSGSVGPMCLSLSCLMKMFLLRGLCNVESDPVVILRDVNGVILHWNLTSETKECQGQS